MNPIFSSPDFWRGVLVGVCLIAMFFFGWLVLEKTGVIDMVRGFFLRWRGRKLDLEILRDRVRELNETCDKQRAQIEELKNSNVDLGDDVIQKHKKIEKLEKSNEVQSHMIDRLADHCKSLDPSMDRAQYLVSARTHAENEMEKNGG